MNYSAKRKFVFFICFTITLQEHLKKKEKKNFLAKEYVGLD